MPRPMIHRLAQTGLTKLAQLHASRVPGILTAPDMHRRDIDKQPGRHPRKIEAKHIGAVHRLRRIKHHALRPIIVARLGRRDRLRLLEQRVAAAVVEVPRRLGDGDAQVGDDVEAHAAAEEHRAFEGEGLAGPLFLVVQQEAGDQAGALGEAHDAVVGALAAEEVEEPAVRGADGGDGGPVPEGVVGGRVEDGDAGGGVGREGRVDEVEGVG